MKSTYLFLSLISLVFVSMPGKGQHPDGVITVTTSRDAAVLLPAQPLDLSCKHQKTYKHTVSYTEENFQVIFHITRFKKEECTDFEWQQVEVPGKDLQFELTVGLKTNGALELQVNVPGTPFGYTMPTTTKGHSFGWIDFAPEQENDLDKGIPVLLFYEKEQDTSIVDDLIKKNYDTPLDLEAKDRMQHDLLEITDCFFLISYDIVPQQKEHE